MAKVFKFYQDSGHGWLAVKVKLLEDLGLTNKITQFSYVNGKTVYLEEDLDVGTFKAAYEQRFGTLETKSVHHGDRSWIRNMNSFGHFVPTGLGYDPFTVSHTPSKEVVEVPASIENLSAIVGEINSVNVGNDF